MSGPGAPILEEDADEPVATLAPPVKRRAAATASGPATGRRGTRPRGQRRGGGDAFWVWQRRAAPYLFILPFILLFAVFELYPLGRSLMLSFYTSAGPRQMRYIGWGNYGFLAHDRLFWWAAANTALFTIGYLLLQAPLSLGLALLLNHRGVRCRSGFRFAFFSTYLVGQVFVAVLFALILDCRHGLLNQGLAIAARRPMQIEWLTNPLLILPAMLMASLWLTVGFGMIYLLAALQAVDGQLYEAAAVDGAGRWSRFWHVTLPGIGPVLGFLVLVGTINGLQLFELPYVLLQGAGPNCAGLTIVMYLFVAGFESGNLGYASAIGWVLAVLTVGIALLEVWMLKLHRKD